MHHVVLMSFMCVMQVLCSSLVFREDIDVGFVVLGDLQKKCKCIQLGVEDIVQSMRALRSKQLHIMYSVMGLEEPSDDIAPDLDGARALLHQLPGIAPTSTIYVEDPQQAMGLDNIEAVTFPSQPFPEGVEGLHHLDSNIAHRPNDVHNLPERCALKPTSLSSYEALCAMHSKNPSTPTLMDEVMGPGPWFSRTPGHTFALAPPWCRTAMSQGRKASMEDITPQCSDDKTTLRPSSGAKNTTDLKDSPLDSMKDMKDTPNIDKDDTDNDVEHLKMAAPSTEMVDVSSDTEDDPLTPITCSLASEVIEKGSEINDHDSHHTLKKDPELDDVLGRTVHKSDGR